MYLYISFARMLSKHINYRKSRAIKESLLRENPQVARTFYRRLIVVSAKVIEIASNRFVKR